MSNLPLRTRRALARGIGARVGGAWGRRHTTGDGNRATLTTAMTGTNNDLTLIAKTPGTGTTLQPGNGITLTIAVAGANTPLSVSVAGNAITVNAATNGSSAVTSTAADVRKAINFNKAASALVHAQNAPGNDGTGVVTALASTPLAGATAIPVW